MLSRLTLKMGHIEQHVLVHEKDLDQTTSIVGNLIKDCQAALQKK